jgi:thioesterase domain-containing protein/acyl carrier protein
LTPNGKVDRKALPAPEGRGVEKGYVPPCTPTEELLAGIWAEVLRQERVGIHDNFFELGGHSLMAVRLMAQIQQALGRHLPLALLFQAPTIKQLATLLHEQTDVASWSWSSLVPIQPNGSAPPLFCVPGGGGNVLYFHALAQHLGPEQPFYGLQARGLDGESAPHTRVEDMAAYYIEAIQAVQPQGPYVLGGHSFGGRVAFEMAQQLRKRGHEVARLFILDASAPVFAGTPIPDDTADDVTLMVTIARLAERLFGQSLGITQAELQALDWEAQLHYLNERLQAVNMLPRGGGVHQVRGLMQVSRAVSRIQYLPREVQLTPITLLRASEYSPEDGFDDSLTLPQDPTWGWSRFATGRVEVYAVPGDHVTMMAEPHVRSLAERLSACLARVRHTASVAAGWE